MKNSPRIFNGSMVLISQIYKVFPQRSYYQLSKVATKTVKTSENIDFKDAALSNSVLQLAPSQYRHWSFASSVHSVNSSIDKPTAQPRMTTPSKTEKIIKSLAS